MKLTFKVGFNMFIKIFIMGSARDDRGSEKYDEIWEKYDEIWRNELLIYRDKKEDHLIPSFSITQARSYLKNRIKKL